MPGGAHARSSGRIVTSSYLGGSDVFERAATELWDAYADGNERDDAVVQAERDRRITVARGLRDCHRARAQSIDLARRHRYACQLAIPSRPAAGSRT